MIELDQLATHLFELYHSDLLQCLCMNDLNFTQALYKHELFNYEVYYKLHSMTTVSDKASFFLEHAIRPGLNYEKFRKLLSAMKESSQDNVIDLAYQLQLQLIFLRNCDAGNVQGT